ncbi:MAG: hypothetical protein JJP05_07465 [cyanobacterium endosymbiont of Rhopalodia gibba]
MRQSPIAFLVPFRGKRWVIASSILVLLAVVTTRIYTLKSTQSQSLKSVISLPTINCTVSDIVTKKVEVD